MLDNQLISALGRWRTGGQVWECWRIVVVRYWGEMELQLCEIGSLSEGTVWDFRLVQRLSATLLRPIIEGLLCYTWAHKSSAANLLSTSQHGTHLQYMYVNTVHPNTCMSSRFPDGDGAPRRVCGNYCCNVNHIMLTIVPDNALVARLSNMLKCLAPSVKLAHPPTGDKVRRHSWLTSIATGHD